MQMFLQRQASVNTSRRREGSFGSYVVSLETPSTSCRGKCVTVKLAHVHFYAHPTDRFFSCLYFAVVDGMPCPLPPCEGGDDGNDAYRQAVEPATDRDGLPGARSFLFLSPHQKLTPRVDLCQVPMFAASGLHVRFLKVFEKSNYQTIKWVRYITKAGSYQHRI